MANVYRVDHRACRCVTAVSPAIIDFLFSRHDGVALA